MLFAVIGVMLTAAVLVVAVPLYRAQQRLTSTSIIAIIVVTGVAAAVYSQIGSPNVAPQDQSTQSVDDVIASLASRLQENPNDLAGWKMLGRSYLQMRNFPGAIAALERAVEMEDGQNGQTLADLGEAVLLSDGRTLQGRAGELFENALAVAPNNPKALFYSGLAAAERGDNELGATRWGALLATSPPPNIQDILRQRIAELRGEAPPAPAPVPAADPGTVLTVNVSLGDGALGNTPPNAPVFIIARDPAQPTPPIAAVRWQVSDLPAAIPLSDANAMVAGRLPSGFAQLEIVARVSLTGQPSAQTGDWFGQQVVDMTTTDTVKITIDQQVP